MIYLDNSATTRPCPEAVEAMTKALTENWGNPSALYDFGIRRRPGAAYRPPRRRRRHGSGT